MYIVCLLLAIACICDYKTKKIPNVLQIVMLFAGLIIRYLNAGWEGIALYLPILGIIVLALFPFFSIGALGAGDVKLLAVTGALFEKDTVLFFMLITFLLAGLAGATSGLVNSIGDVIKNKKQSGTAGICRELNGKIVETEGVCEKKIITNAFLETGTETGINTEIKKAENTKTGNIKTECTETGNDKAFNKTGKRHTVVMSGPILISLLLHLGGIY